MRSKVVAAEMATAAGIRDGDLQRARRRARSARALGGRAGGHALRRRRPARYSSFKLWLQVRQALARDACVVDAGAARALREGGTSLLPVGIVDVARRASTPATRSRSAATARAIGKGICNYSADRAAPGDGPEVAREVREVLPRATEEAVHRDYFVLA